MKLSIITVNLNNLPGLQRTLESVHSQSWQDFEHIVIDGGSTDGSAEYLAQKSKWLTWFVSEKDRGIYHAMNKGIAKATGIYLLFLNSGDYLSEPAILETVLPHLTGEGLIYGDLTLVKKDGSLETKAYPDKLTFSDVWDHSLPHPATFIRKDLFGRIGLYNERMKITADWQFFMLAVFSSKTSYKHINLQITVFSLDGICNDPKNLRRTEREKKQFYCPKILLVGMVDSIHTAKWLKQLQVNGCRLSVFPAYEDKAVHKDIPARVRRLGNFKTFPLMDYIIRSVQKKINPNYYPKRLARIIRRIRPDVVHSLETQGAGYLVAEARKSFRGKGRFPKWWHSNWGSDIFLFGRLKDHQERIRQVMVACDYYSCEGQRDVELAVKFGFRGTVMPVYPNMGGMKADVLERLRKETVAPSQRKVIMLKGYQGWAGRALTGIRALERCADVLGGYTIIIYCNTDSIDVKIAAELLSQTAGIEVIRLPVNTPNEEILTYHGRARISIGLSISDAISTSLLEAMAMGSFPIQSGTSCASDWITDGVSGFIVPPEDPEIIEQVVRKALADSELVDAASGINYEKIRKDDDYDKLRELTIQSYFKIYMDNRR